MSQLLGLEFPATSDLQTTDPMIPQGTSTGMDSQNDYTYSLGFSNLNTSYSPETQQWLQSYPELSIPLHGYDFHSFT